VANSDNSVIGTGSLMLDIVTRPLRSGREVIGTFAGGSCGNVLAILSFLGWQSYPLAQIGEDDASAALMSDLRHVGVDTRFVSTNPTIHTPFVYQMLRSPGDLPTQAEAYGRVCEWSTPGACHRFAVSCPWCGSDLPRYAAHEFDVPEDLFDLTGANVYYFDVINASSYALAHRAAARGALVFCELSNDDLPSMIEQVLKSAHIVKFSGERFPVVPSAIHECDAPLVIRTLGADGLEFRWRKTKWQRQPASTPALVRDTVGCGDWCSASLIHSLGPRGSASLTAASHPDILYALRLAQALAAQNCGFEAARGAMYLISAEECLNMAASGDMHGILPRSSTPRIKCPGCTA